MKFEIGMKVYSTEWFLKHQLSYDKAAAVLQDWGVSSVMAQSRYLQMPDTAVKSEIPPEWARRYETYEDLKFREALAKRGIEYWAAALMFFDPESLQTNPERWAVGDDGEKMPKTDWYIGIPPSHEDQVQKKIEAILPAVKALQPDGVFLGFMRWPNFWELWLPEMNRGDFREYSFDRHTLDRFERETGISLPDKDAKTAAEWIQNNARLAWTDWKCQIVAQVIHQVKAACQVHQPDLKMMLNTVPFGKNDFSNAEEEVFGQRFELLAGDVDVFEVMTYHQILKRPTQWVREIGEEVKQRSGRKTTCTIQARPLYVDGMHANRGRKTDLNVAEFEALVSEAASSDLIDGVNVFMWADFLNQVYEDHNHQYIDILKKYARS